MKSWQIYSEARKAFKNKFHEIYGNRSSRLVDAWAQDPNLCATSERNPIDRLEEMLARLVEEGRGDVAQAAVRILAAAAKCDVCQCGYPEPNRESVYEEMVDDYQKLAAFQEALKGDDLELVDRTKADTIRDLEETREQFIRERQLRRPPK